MKHFNQNISAGGKLSSSKILLESGPLNGSLFGEMLLYRRVLLSQLTGVFFFFIQGVLPLKCSKLVPGIEKLDNMVSRIYSYKTNLKYRSF